MSDDEYLSELAYDAWNDAEQAKHHEQLDQEEREREYRRIEREEGSNAAERFWSDTIPQA